MTETELKNQIVSAATAWLGAVRGDATHKAIIDLYNSHAPLARGYKVTYTDAWCATFVSAVAIKCSMTDIMPTECSCSNMIALYQKLGRWQENDAYVPAPGDLIMYDWDDSGAGDCTGAPEHVGIVEKVSGNTITVIEGNYSNSVKRRSMTVNGRYIRGYCTPDYAGKAKVLSVTGTNTAATTNKNEEDDNMDVNRFKELWKEMRKELQDNDSSAYSQEARDWAVSTGLIAGGSSGDFNGMWEDVLTREQLVTVLYRFAKLTELV